MPRLTDQCGRKLVLGRPVKRIVSTVPSITELLYDLGLYEEVVGITAYCVHPRPWLKEKTVIGGTKNLQIEKIKQLQPDLIIANKEENIKEQIEALEKDIPVWLTDVVSIEDALQMIADVSFITGTEQRGLAMVERLQQMLSSFNKSPQQKIRVATLIWKNPLMAVSGNTYINAVIELIGLQNVFATSPDRYPAIALETMREADPDLILLTSEPYSFKSLDMRELSTYFARAKIRIVDGEHFTWYGSHMIKAFPYLQRLQKDLGLVFNIV